MTTRFAYAKLRGAQYVGSRRCDLELLVHAPSKTRTSGDLNHSMQKPVVIFQGGKNMSSHKAIMSCQCAVACHGLANTAAAKNRDRHVLQIAHIPCHFVILLQLINVKWFLNFCRRFVGRLLCDCSALFSSTLDHIISKGLS